MNPLDAAVVVVGIALLFGVGWLLVLSVLTDAAADRQFEVSERERERDAA